MQPHGDGELCALINQDQIVKIQVASTNLLGTGKVKTGQLAERTCNAEEIKKLQIQLHSELKKKKNLKISVLASLMPIYSPTFGHIYKAFLSHSA